MNWGSRNIVGLALGDRVIQCAQITVKGGKSVVERLAAFELPTNAGYDRPEALGQSLKSFLHARRFTASQAMVGVPMRWIVSHTADVPPSDSAAARGLLRIHAERLSSGDELNMVYDCVGEPGGNAASQIMLVGLMRKQLDSIVKMCDSAGMSVIGLTATSLAISKLLDARSEMAMLVLADHGTELIAGRGVAVPSVRHLRAMPAKAGVELSLWDGELRRACALAGHSSAKSGKVVMIDAVGLTPADRTRLGQVIGGNESRSVNVGELSVAVRDEALNGSAGRLQVDTFVPAVALAVSGRQRAGLSVNFMKSRLAAPPVRRFGRGQMAAIAAGVLVLGGLVALYATMQHRENQAAELLETVKKDQPRYAVAKAEIAQFTYGRQYFETRTPVLDCLKQITLTFRDGESIWITAFTLKDTGRGTLQGKSTDQRVILAVLDRLRNNAMFSDVQLQDMRESSGRDREIIFSIKLTYIGKSGS